MTADRLTRYRRGEHEAVWRELRACKTLDVDRRDEALAVARETMTRVAAGADLIAQRLKARGWRPLGGRFRDPPSAAGRALAARLAKVTGAALPPSLEAFWEVVGGIDLVWDYRRGEAPSLGVALSMAEQDPLEVGPPSTLGYQFETWDDERNEGERGPGDPFEVELAADALHKANISGGAPYGVVLPFAGADPIWANEEHGLPFVDYLRLCFRWGGFPGLERHARVAGVGSLVAELTREVEPF